MHNLEEELSMNLADLEPCTHSEAQVSLAPIVKRYAKGQSVILVQCQKAEIKKENKAEIEIQKKAEFEKEQKAEEDVDRIMRKLAERTEMKTKLKRVADLSAQQPNVQRFFKEDEDAEAKPAPGPVVEEVVEE